MVGRIQLPRPVAVGNHLTRRLGSTPLFGPRQPPVAGGESKREARAQIVARFVSELLATDPGALVVVTGDCNEFPFGESLPAEERYTYVFDGNAQAIDHLLVSPALGERLVPDGFDIVHVNAEYREQASDHDPQVARFRVPAA